jgi:putative heme-binding domain-containing protein
MQGHCREEILKKGLIYFGQIHRPNVFVAMPSNDYGGNVGPRLNGVAKRLKHEQLLEALIEPSARIAPGFGIVTLETKNKQNLNGILQQEKPEGYVMKIGDRPDTLVKKSDVANRVNSASSMPPMHLLLNKKRSAM